MSAHHSPRRLERAGDAELVRLTRKGDTDAYATLFRRHASAAASVARSVTSSYEPDDLVSEAYARILQALKSGNGPTNAFRPYLFTTVRNIAASWGRAGKDAVPLEPEELDTLAVQEDHSLVTLDRSLTAQAFRSLPPRWQEALWYSEVEGMQPAELAPLVGLSAQAAAALCYRAREGLRQAWIRAHLTSADLEPECAWTVEHLAAHSRGRLGKRDNARVDAHLQTCELCTMAAAEAEETGSRLALVLLPLILGSGAATVYAATLKTGVVVGAAAGAAAAGAGAASAGGAGSSGGIGGFFSGATGVIVGTAASVVVVGAAVAGVLIATAPGGGTDASPAIVAQGSGSSQPGSSSTGPSTSASAPPAPPPAPAPSDVPAPSQSPPPASAPSDSTTGGSSTAPSAPASPTSPTSPTGPTGPTAPAQPQPPAAPTIGSVDTGGNLYYPLVSGTATPGATVTASAGGAATSVTADSSGAWSAQVAPSSGPAAPAVSSSGAATVSPALFVSTSSTARAGTAAPADAQAGSQSTVTITARQTVDNVPSQEASRVVDLALTPPQAALVLPDGSPIVIVRVTGAPDATVEILIDGTSTGIQRLGASGQTVDLVRSLIGSSGTHDVAVRYADGSGRFGPSTHLSVTVGGRDA
ncbi:sigma-70 family RNA polymerase sigma factor [Humibacter sp.]|uniref:sigma-70 family RNA polymerase sigma factor n=1 Tax=Humibacter sp. TaxID=1940291 RepID=UPI003F806EEA